MTNRGSDPELESPTAEADLLQAGIAEHQAGRVDRAVAWYEKALAADGANELVLHLLGVACQQRGDHARAAGLLGRAASLRPDDPAIQTSLADVYLALGDHAQAAERAGEALRLGANDPNVHYLFGLALHGLRRYEEAAVQLRRAVSLRPDFVAAHNHLGNALRSLGRLSEARDAYMESLRLDPVLAVAHCNLGSIHLVERRFEEARLALARAVELEPDRAFFWERLAEFYQWTEQYEAAIPCWQRVLALEPEAGSRPRLALGRALHERNRVQEAEEHYRAAVAAKPGSAKAQIDLGRLCQEQGRFAEAEAAYRAAIREEPALPLAHVRLATLLGGALPDADREALRKLLDSPVTDPPSRARVLFAIGHVLDERGELGPAAEYFRKANLASLAHDGRPFHPEVLGPFVDDSSRAYCREFFHRMAGAGLDTLRPVFIVGLPRSGSTLLEQILASHPQVHAAGELALAQRAFETLPRLVNQALPSSYCVPYLRPPMIRSLAESYLDRLRELDDGRAARIVDKMPENYKHLGLLTTLFPRATVIHCRRDLRDTALSCYTADFLHVPWANHPQYIAAAFRAYLRLMDHWRSVLPVPIHEFAYEDTVRDLEGASRRLVAALGLEWDAACLEFQRNRRPVRTGSIVQVRQPVHQRSVGRWRRYEHEFADLFAALPPDG